MLEIDLPPPSQRLLIQLSRATLDNFVRGQRRPSASFDDPHLQATIYGAFVSLHADRELRGCVGNCAPDTPLFETVIEMTEAAASRDHRMEPVSPTELAAIKIDISVLSPLQRAQDPLALHPGKHGLYIARGRRRGVLLPQVAAEYGWDMQTFLEQTCRKAGLNKSAWQDPEAEVSAFTALVITEER